MTVAPATPLGHRCYLAGPMTGYHHYNAEAFRAAEDALRSRGFAVVTPFECNNPVWRRLYGRDFDPYTDTCEYGDPELAEMIAEDFKALAEADFIAVLPGWRCSKGARAEVLVAQQLMKPVVHARDLTPITERVVTMFLGVDLAVGESRPVNVFDSLTVSYRPPAAESALQEAQRLVHGDRGDSYGHPHDDYTRTGRMWGAILGIGDIPARICALMMAAMKIGREVHKPKRDNRVDLAGYAECAQMIAERDDELTAAADAKVA
ncbi:MAG: hypothetical protein JWL95_3326 [Gemmatimonadetes bacterium]|nr:hypothetical protein [Gemmatimonadota bacterium]